MNKTFSEQLLDLDMLLTRIASATTGATSERAMILAGYCRFYAGQAAIRELQRSNAFYTDFVEALNDSTNRANTLCEDLSKISQRIADVASTLDAVGKLIEIIFKVLPL